jgi:cell division protein ZapA (FtsZ GTPase activity inhibitor)
MIIKPPAVCPNQVYLDRRAAFIKSLLVQIELLNDQAKIKEDEIVELNKQMIRLEASVARSSVYLAKLQQYSVQYDRNNDPF